MCGAPGSGKSTKAKDLAKQYDALIIDGDEIKDELGLPDYHHDWVAIDDIIMERIEDNLHRSLIIDGTFPTIAAREEIFMLLSSYGFDPIDLVYVHTDLEECLARNRSRDRQVPDHLVRLMHEKIAKDRPNFHQEGFDVIYWM